MSSIIHTYGTAGGISGADPFARPESKKKQAAMEREVAVDKTTIATQVVISALATTPPAALAVGIAYVGSKLLGHIFNKESSPTNNYTKFKA